MKPIRLLLPMLLLAACQAPTPRMSTPMAPRSPIQARAMATPRVISPARGLLKSEFSFSADKTELTLTMIHDTGETVKTRTVRKPLTGATVQTETVIERNGAVVQRRATTSAEAELSVKVAANNGWQDVYRELKARYQAAGLIS